MCGEVVDFTVFFDTLRQGRYYATFVLPVTTDPGCAPSNAFDEDGAGRRRIIQMANRTTDAGAYGRFDAFELSAGSDEIAGKTDARRLSRVADQLAAGIEPAPVTWRIGGGRDASSRPALVVQVEGAVPLVCQRCMQPFASPVSQQTVLLLARDEAELARLDAEESEVVLANTMLDPLSLVEDELLLSLPISPRHGEDECAAARRAVPEAGKPSPFAALAALKARDPG